MRSNDVIWGLSYDLYVLTMFQEMMASELNVELGWYQHNAASLHIYERHLDMAARISAGPTAHAPTMPVMSDLPGCARLLEFERALRVDDTAAAHVIEHTLSPYWSALAIPLRERAGRVSS